MAIRLHLKKLCLKDKFHFKKDWSFLHRRNERCSVAARALKGPCLFLDSSKLRTARRFLQDGVAKSRIYPVNGRDAGGFLRKARLLGVRPVVSMFHASAKQLQMKDISLCYNDGTHGDQDLVWRDMEPLLPDLSDEAYLSYTFALRTRNALPVTSSLSTLLRLAALGFQPPGGWGRLTEAFTFDGRMFNVQLKRGEWEARSLQEPNGYSFSAKYQSVRPPAPSSLEELRQRCLKLVKGKSLPLRGWEQLRKRILALDARSCKTLFEALPRSNWISEKYEAWLEKGKKTLSRGFLKRFPQRRRKVELMHWTRCKLQYRKRILRSSASGALVCGGHHPGFSGYLDWLRDLLPREALQKSLCHSVKSSLLSPALKANMTRGRSCLPQTEASLADVADRLGKYSLAFLPLLDLQDYDRVKTLVEEHVQHLRKRGACLVLHLRSKLPVATLAWAVWITSNLAQEHDFLISAPCQEEKDAPKVVGDEGRGLMDFSGIATLVFVR